MPKLSIVLHVERFGFAAAIAPRVLAVVTRKS